MVTTSHHPLQPTAARRDTPPASLAPTTAPITTPCSRLCLACAAPEVVRCLSEPPGRVFQSKNTSRKTHLPGQLFTVSPLSSKHMVVTRPTLQATTRHWQSFPRSPDRQEAPCGVPTLPWSPKVLLLGGRHLLPPVSTTTIASLKAPSSFCSWSCKFLKLSLVRIHDSAWKLTLHAEASCHSQVYRGGGAGLALQQRREVFVRAQNLPSSQLQPHLLVCSTGKDPERCLAGTRHLATPAGSGASLWDPGAITSSKENHRYCKIWPQILKAL